MRCYYRNGISCGANRREFEDQSVIKGKLDQIGIRPIRVSHFGDFWRAFREEMRREEEEEEEGEENFRYGLLWFGMDLYGLLWISMDFLTFVWISLFHF